MWVRMSGRRGVVGRYLEKDEEEKGKVERVKAYLI